LTRIESEAFSSSSLQSILLPSTILFVASDAVDVVSHIRFADFDSCPEFDGWCQLKRSGIAVDFRRIQRFGSCFQCLINYLVNLSTFEERSIICESNEVSNQIYHRVEDEFLVVVKSMPHRESIAKSPMEHEIETLINLHHPCIAAPIGFVLPIESGNRQELKIIRLYSDCCSLSEVLLIRPVWWTSTIKAKVIVGIVLGLRYAHSLGLLHGHLTANNILFDSDHCVQIVDFQSMLLEVGESEEGTQLRSFSRERWLSKMDLHAFASILF
jgi:serine/threonine protein kinase